MARQQWHPSDDELARSLADLGEHIAYPPVLDLAVSVRERLAGQERPDVGAGLPVSSSGSTTARPSTRRRPRAPWLSALRRRAALVLVALLLLAGGVLAVSPAARTAVAQWLGPRGVVFFPRPAHLPAPAGAGLRLGCRVTLGAAQGDLPFRVLIPAHALGAPDEIYVRSIAGGSHTRDDMVALVYRARAGLPRAHNSGVGLLLTETRGFALGGKFIGPGTTLEFVTVDGQPGYWLTGAPHLFAYMDGENLVKWDTLRLAGNVLLWNRNGLVLRLETALPKDAAVRIAAMVR